jgi:NAD+ diphosphatase
MDHVQFVRSVDWDAVAGEDAYWYLVTNDAVALVRDGKRLRVPDQATLRALGVEPPPGILLGRDDGHPCFAAEITPTDLPSSLELVPLRSAFGQLPELQYGIAGYAVQIAHWYRTARYCPVCATANEPLAGERAKRCPACGFVQYPRVSPAIIVLIYREGQVMLTRQPSWTKNMYSLVAGFVEPGESLEECLRREIAEEVGVEVDLIRYLGSQTWPFPHQLMVGFVARYSAGEISLDGLELEHAQWFDLDNLPGLSAPLSISRQIINWHLASQQDPTIPFPVDRYPEVTL